MKSITSIPAVAGIAVAACLASSAVAGPVAGQTINLEFKVSRPALPVHINYVFGERASSMNRSGGSFGYAGFVNWHGGIKTFCVQIKEGIDPNTSIEYTFTELENTPESSTEPGAMGMMRATMIRDLYSRWYHVVEDQPNTNDGRDLCAAFQAMVWEITHETLDDTGSSEPGSGQVDALSLDMGAMQLNGMTTGAAYYFGQMKMSLGGDNHDMWWDRLGENLWGLTNPIYQDQIIVVPGAAAGFMGLGLCAARRRRRR